jgi:hypothetical protein
MTEAENLKLKEETPVLKETDSPDELANNFEVTFNQDATRIEAELAAQSMIPTEKKEVQDTHEVVLPYKPFASTEKWLAHRFSAWSAPKTWFATILVVTFFGFGGPGEVIKIITNLMLSPSNFGGGLNLQQSEIAGSVT